MTESWKDVVIDSKERTVFEALADPAWDFRTVAGLAKATGLAEDEVKAVLARYSNLVRRSLVPDKSGRELYTLAEKDETAGEVLKALKSFITKSAG